MNNIQKAAVIGCGFVGSSIAFTLMQSGIFSELVLIDANRDKAEGEAMDLSHGLPFTHPMDMQKLSQVKSIWNEMISSLRMTWPTAPW